jgi:hypothetical protein
LLVPGSDSGVCGELASVPQAFQVRKFGKDDGGAELTDAFDAGEL